MIVEVLDAGIELRADASRVLARLFLPGASTPGGVSRSAAVLERVLALPPSTLAAAARDVSDSFDSRYDDLLELLRTNAALVRPPDAPELSDPAMVVLGAAFTAEQSVEGAALCNPSAVVHPDQDGLVAGELRILVSVRSIGEPHLSSIEFCEAIIGPGRTWRFLPRRSPLAQATITEGVWSKRHFVRALEHDGGTDELVRSLAQHLPATFASGRIGQAIAQLPAPLLQHPGARDQLDAVRVVAGSAYRASFAPDTPISARVLLPVTDEEAHGIEDLRLVRTDGEEAIASPGDYVGTYTAFDGRSIASRRLHTRDFRTFTVDRLTGAPARTKGMALFPRRIAGVHYALGRSDGESIGLTSSVDGLHWRDEQRIYSPRFAWDVVQSGNCGAPLETPAGWLVLTHGVGLMRRYAIGALLLDLDDPTSVIGVLAQPLVEPRSDLATGYVPNVAYSCGGVIHEGILWVPHGVGDNRIRVVSVDATSLIYAMQQR